LLGSVAVARPGEVADAAEDGVWDIGLIGDEPARAQKIAFSPAYVEIASTYLVPAGSPLASGLVASLIERHRIQGLSVAPPAPPA
jgi:hypothetical protein